MNSVQAKAIDSRLRLAASVLRGEDMDESLQEEMQKVKRKAADGLESVRRMKKQRTTKPKGFRDDPSSAWIKQKTKQNQLKTPARRRKKNKVLWD